MEALQVGQKELVVVIAKELKIGAKQIEQVISLIEEGCTIPFIARYRKELTGSLDEVQLKAILDKWEYGLNLQKRKEEVIRLIEEKGKLTPQLKSEIEKADKLQTVEDLYRPYKEKRRTKAAIAKEKGLEPFAQWLLSFPTQPVEVYAENFVTEDVPSSEDAINGALDIIAEMIADEATYRQWIRDYMFHKGMVATRVKNEEKDEKNVYEMYYTYEEPIRKIVPHRVLALNRGEKEDILKVGIEVNVDDILAYLQQRIIKKENTTAAPYLKTAIEDSFKRLISPSIEREIRKELTERAEEQAIRIFSENLRNLLLQPPLKGKVVLGVDPAFRTGCKLGVVDETGKVLHIDVIYPNPPISKVEQAKEKVMAILHRYQVEIVAIGNGTASRETEQFISNVLKEYSQSVSYIIVNEAGASVYSASDLAREEFPDLQVEERSALSIARRLQDPLSELVKIDPKAIGVGQYQHDVSQKRLNESLTFVVETAVNQVGVNVNTASIALLQYVSGLSKTVATNIVKAREEKGRFQSRKELKGIPRLGAKTYEQSIGFLRVVDGDNVLDRTPIHPERYADVERLLAFLNESIDKIGTEQLVEKLKHINKEQVADTLQIGLPTLEDIIDALMKPGRDLRDDLPKPLLKKDVLTMDDLTKGMELEGVVRNVVDFGAFVDVGLKHDGLVHISKLKNGFVKHPLDVVSVGQIVKVWVLDVDKKKDRVSLSMIPL
ncbi:MAG: Tex family protein [Bacillaceae bacterium]